MFSLSPSIDVLIHGSYLHVMTCTDSIIVLCKILSHLLASITYHTADETASDEVVEEPLSKVANCIISIVSVHKPSWFLLLGSA